MAEEDNIEMKDLDRLKEVESEITAEEEETKVDDDDRDELLERKKQLRDPNVSITVPQGFNPDIEGVPEPPKGMTRIHTNNTKKFLKDALDVMLNR